MKQLDNSKLSTLMKNIATSPLHTKTYLDSVDDELTLDYYLNKVASDPSFKWVIEPNYGNRVKKENKEAYAKFAEQAAANGQYVFEHKYESLVSFINNDLFKKYMNPPGSITLEENKLNDNITLVEENVLLTKDNDLIILHASSNAVYDKDETDMVKYFNNYHGSKGFSLLLGRVLNSQQIENVKCVVFVFIEKALPHAFRVVAINLDGDDKQLTNAKDAYNDLSEIINTVYNLEDLRIPTKSPLEFGYQSNFSYDEPEKEKEVESEDQEESYDEKEKENEL